jgi:crotonobetainyl-CoA:carnitine CoA-transferase CaiB-like acyl-CoA transferase
MDEAVRHEHNQQRNNFVSISGSVRPNVAPRFEGTELNADAEVCRSGSDTLDILGDLQYADSEVEELIRSGIVEPAD